MSDSFWLHGLQQARLPCPLLPPAVCSNWRPLSQWYYPTISFSVALFFSCLQSFPALGSFPMSQLVASGGQSIGTSASASVLPMNQFSSVQSFSCVCTYPTDLNVPGFPVHHQLLEFTQTHVHWVSDAIQPSHPLSSPSPPAFNLSQHQGPNESVLRIKWPKCWSFSFSISPSNEYAGLISFRIDWLDLLAVHGTLKSLLQHHCSKASILRHSAFFILQFSHPYMTTGKTIVLTIQIFVGKGMSLFFNTLSRFVIDILPREKQASFILMAAVTICSDFWSPRI